MVFNQEHFKQKIYTQALNRDSSINRGWVAIPAVFYVILYINFQSQRNGVSITFKLYSVTGFYDPLSPGFMIKQENSS